MKPKRMAITAIVIVALAGLAYMQFRTWRTFDWKIFFDQTGEANPLRLLAALVLIYLTYYLRALRWAVMLRPVRKVAGARLLSAMVIGFTGVAVLGRPGDLIRPYLIARRESLRLSSQVAVLAVERVFDIGC